LVPGTFWEPCSTSGQLQKLALPTFAYLLKKNVHLIWLIRAAMEFGFPRKINLDRRSPRQVRYATKVIFPTSLFSRYYLPVPFCKKQKNDALVHHPLNNGKMVQGNILSKLANLRKMRKPTRDKNIFFFFSS
jgi:hypothetical protein